MRFSAIHLTHVLSYRDTKRMTDDTYIIIIIVIFIIIFIIIFTIIIIIIILSSDSWHLGWWMGHACISFRC